MRVFRLCSTLPLAAELWSPIAGRLLTTSRTSFHGLDSNCLPRLQSAPPAHSSTRQHSRWTPTEDGVASSAAAEGDEPVEPLTDEDVDPPVDLSPLYATESADHYINLEARFGAQNYAPLPVVLVRGLDVHVWDVHGFKYFDFLSSYSAVNQGHCHPKIIGAMMEQAHKLTLTSRAFYNDRLGEFERYICQLFGYDKMVPMNTGVEAGETAIKLARKWGYQCKKIEPGRARVLFCQNNFWGRTLAAISISSDATARQDYEPFMPNFDSVPYNDLAAIRRYLEQHGQDVCALMLEPIQGEAGVIIPSDGYLKGVRALCDEFNVLMLADEVQTGLGRTGKLLAVGHERVRPDLVMLGKALSGGMMPVSCVLGDDCVLGLLKPGEHGSTYGGNPLACAVASEAVSVLLDEGLVENARAMGKLLRAEMRKALIPTGLVKQIRGRGLMNAVQVVEHPPPTGQTAEAASTGMEQSTAWQLCLKMAGYGVKSAPDLSCLGECQSDDSKLSRLLAKPTQGHTIRLAPPLTITAWQVENAIEIMHAAFTAHASQLDLLD